MVGLKDKQYNSAFGRAALAKAAFSNARACVAGGLLLGAFATSGAQAVATPSAQQNTVPQAATATPAPNANGAPAGTSPAVNAARAKVEPSVPPLTANLGEYAGKTVVDLRYEGVDFDKSDKLLSELSQKEGDPLDPEKVRAMTRRLFQTGRYRNIAVRIAPEGAGLKLIFAGTARYYVGRIQINGIQEDRLTSLVEYGTQLNPGTAFTNSMVTTATGLVKQVLAQAGYYEPTIAVKTDRDDAGQQVNVTYTIDVGKQARVGTVTLIGKDPGIDEKEFRKKGKLKSKVHVGRETTSTALGNMRTYFQKKDRLEAIVTLQKSTYDPINKTVNYAFNVDQGPIVLVKTEGAKFSKSRLHLLVPVYEEGAVDIDLLNEGKFNIHDYLQQEGYFDATVDVAQMIPGQVSQLPAGTKAPETFTVSQPGGAVPRTTLPAPPPPAPNEFKPVNGTETVLYTIDKGVKHKVLSVDVTGSKYFSAQLLEEGLSVKKADLYQRSGRYSAQLVTADQNQIATLYRANGFKDAKVTSTVKDIDVKNGKGKPGEISVIYKVVEGEQQKFGAVTITGADAARLAVLQPLLQASAGQPFSLVTLSGDRDELRSYYVSNGFDQARVEVAQVIDKADPTRTDVAYNVTEGEQVFIGKILESGVEHTRQALVDRQTEVHPGDPLDQSALLNTQRKLYDLALFNEVVAAVQNPTGDAELKNVLLQITEAKRWDVTYGFGFEAQTGTPTCTTCTQQGTTKAQQGQAGVSPRVSLDISRINLFGTQDSLALHTTYGLLERVATLTFTNPHLFGSPKFSLQTSGGYSNVQDITTFKSSTLQQDIRVTHKATRKDTFIYNFVYRRVAVDPASLAISANLIPLLSEPVRVAGPGITWFHDTRSPSPLDAAKGSYTSVQQFLATSKLGSQTDFSRTDITNSTYYQFGKKKYVFARNTRFGFISSFGINPNLDSNGNPLTDACANGLLNSNASCNAVPLPERLYAGGATSHRGFPINGAGPRDLQTGFPVGGSSVFINTFELRLPAPTLPIVGDSVSFVVFHDMGNVFYHVGDTFKSIKNFRQPDQATCTTTPNNTGTATPLVAYGTCNFNYYSHALGLGARYKTPVGPIRVDLSYNLNPPVYPIIPTIVNGAYFGGQTPTSNTGSHFQFFFSIGQSF